MINMSHDTEVPHPLLWEILQYRRLAAGTQQERERYYELKLKRHFLSSKLLSCARWTSYLCRKYPSDKNNAIIKPMSGRKEAPETSGAQLLMTHHRPAPGVKVRNDVHAGSRMRIYSQHQLQKNPLKAAKVALAQTVSGNTF